MKLNKDDIYGIAGSVVFHLFILLILGFTVLKTIVPDEDGGILVNFGNVNAASGTFEPKYTGQEPPQETTTPPPPVPEPKVETPKEELVTQDIEESVAIEEAKKKKEKEELRKKEEEKKRKEEAEKERIRKEEAEKKRLAEERRKKEQAISNKVAGAFGMGNQEGDSQGDAGSGTGNQGSPFGNSDHGADEGVGGYGTFDRRRRPSPSCLHDPGRGANRDQHYGRSKRKCYICRDRQGDQHRQRFHAQECPGCGQTRQVQ